MVVVVRVLFAILALPITAVYALLVGIAALRSRWSEL